MTKWLLSFVCLLFALINFGANDSIQKSINRKISIGFEFAPASYLKWSFPEYQTVLLFDPSSGSEKTDNTKKIIPLPICGLHVSYSFNKIIKIETAVSYSKEEAGGIILIDTTNYYYTRRGIRTYITRFVQVPLLINFMIQDKSKKRNFTNCKIGLNFDIIYYETKSYADELKFSLNGSVISQSFLFSKEQPNKYSFNKITPFIFIGREHFSKNENFSFSYGSMFTFKSIYQKHNTAEYFKNYKITPIIIGIACHF